MNQTTLERSPDLDGVRFVCPPFRFRQRTRPHPSFSFRAGESPHSSVFFRASRRHLINLRWVAAVEPDVAGGLVIKLKPGIDVEMSRRRAALFRQALSF